MAGADKVQGRKASCPDTPEKHAQEAGSISVATKSQDSQKQEADQEPAERNNVLTSTRKLPIPAQERERTQESHESERPENDTENDIERVLSRAQNPHNQQTTIEQAENGRKDLQWGE